MGEELTASSGGEGEITGKIYTVIVLPGNIKAANSDLTFHHVVKEASSETILIRCVYVCVCVRAVYCSCLFSDV